MNGPFIQIGDYASYVNINEGRPELGAAPVYNYVMLDTDFLLLPSLSHYFLSTPQGQDRAETFLNTQATLQNGTYGDLLQRNIDHVIELAMPFVESDGNCSNLAVIRDRLVGNWRDSGSGLGFGTVPFDVNSEWGK